MRKVAVFFGGKSCEHEISILTGVMVLNVIDKAKYTVIPVYIDLEGIMYTACSMFDVQVFREGNRKNFQRIFFEGGTMYALNVHKKRVKPLAKIDAALNCCHGGWGEGGGVSALMQLNGIPLASPDMASSAVFMDKILTKLVLQSLNVPTVEYLRVLESDYRKRAAFLLKRIEPRLKYPVVIKPARLGSSIGITLAKNEEEVKAGLETAFALDERVIIERYLPNKLDVNCAAYMREGEIIVSEPEAAFGAGLYSFEEKYIKKENLTMRKNGMSGRGNLPNDGGMVELTDVLRDKIRTFTKTVYKRMHLQGVVRMDFLVNDNSVYLCEVNTVPGSLAYHLFCDRLIDARAFFGDMIEEAIATSGDKEKTLLTMGILKTIEGFVK